MAGTREEIGPETEGGKVVADAGNLHPARDGKMATTQSTSAEAASTNAISEERQGVAGNKVHSGSGGEYRTLYKFSFACRQSGGSLLSTVPRIFERYGPTKYFEVIYR